MASDTSRGQYLTLALFSRRIIESLRDFMRTGSRKRMRTAIPAAIESLQAATDNRKFPTGYGLRVARSYDQVRTITELYPEKKDRTKMIRTLKLLEKDGDSEQQRTAARDAVYFFYAIENRALRNYRHPAPRSASAASVQ